MIRRRVVFSGRVQGVGFRASTVHVSEAHPGVSGLVRNEPDGGVTLEIQGEEGDVDAFIAEVRSRLARFIMGERMEDLPIEADEVGFSIDR